MVAITKRCPMCGNTHTLELNNDIAKQYDRYLAGYGYIQDIQLPAEKREFLMTGFCEKCQDIIFAEPEDE